MKRILSLSALIGLIASGRADAANLAVIANPPTLLSGAVFLVAIGCLVLCIQVLGTVRGGLLSKSWQIFLIGFGLLALSQILWLLQTIEVVHLPSFVVPALLTAMGGTFLYGLMVTKRTLS
ncbi:MAG: hypothetical protein RBT76_06205 [candidate division Zixibacteria bacterium]|jgi:hypothetical protein|nr:hypothetical protein [candidate division Zixibacteria bacterium]